MRTLSALVVGAAVASIALAGCASPAAAPAGGGGAKNSDAAGFVACLKAEGVEARVNDSGGVAVRDSTGGTGEGGEGLLYTESDGTDTWLAVSDSGYFEADPTTQKSYAACEKKFPDFEQPEFTPPGEPVDPDLQQKQLADAIAFARCGRDKGYAWVADPKADAGSAITIPSSVTEEEFRSLIKDCWDEDAKTPLSWNAEGELSFDLTAVLDSIPGLSSGGGVFTQPVAPEEGEG